MKEGSILIQTDRLWLRHIVNNDVDPLLLLFSDPKAMRFFPQTRNRRETIDWVNKIKTHFEKKGHSLYACLRKKDNSFIGYCGLLFQEDVDGNDEIEVGYGLIRKYWHHGYATEASLACINYGFNTFGFNKIISLIRPENVPSKKVAERNGMIIEKEVFRWGHLHLVYMALNSRLQ